MLRGLTKLTPTSRGAHVTRGILRAVPSVLEKFSTSIHQTHNTCNNNSVKEVHRLFSISNSINNIAKLNSLRSWQETLPSSQKRFYQTERKPDAEEGEKEPENQEELEDRAVEIEKPMTDAFRKFMKEREEREAKEAAEAKKFEDRYVERKSKRKPKTKRSFLKYKKWLIRGILLMLAAYSGVPKLLAYINREKEEERPRPEYMPPKQKLDPVTFFFMLMYSKTPEGKFLRADDRRPMYVKPLPDWPLDWEPKPVLVIMLDGVLVNYSYDRHASGFYWKRRHYSDVFVTEMSPYYEVVIISSTELARTQHFLHQVDPLHVALYMYRNNPVMGDWFIKDLTKLNRPVEKTVLLDFEPRCLQPDNTIHTNGLWDGRPDFLLKDLAPFLKWLGKELIEGRIKNVAEELPKWGESAQEIIPKWKKFEEQLNAEKERKRLEREKRLQERYEREELLEKYYNKEPLTPEELTKLEQAMRQVLEEKQKTLHDRPLAVPSYLHDPQ